MGNCAAARHASRAICNCPSSTPTSELRPFRTHTASHNDVVYEPISRLSKLGSSWPSILPTFCTVRRFPSGSSSSCSTRLFQRHAGFLLTGFNHLSKLGLRILLVLFRPFTKWIHLGSCDRWGCGSDSYRCYAGKVWQRYVYTTSHGIGGFRNSHEKMCSTGKIYVRGRNIRPEGWCWTGI